MEDEPESELRFKAFKKLKYLKTNFPIKKIIEKEKTTKIVEETTEPEERIGVQNLSIFYPLYQKANDLNSKLILIEQMGSLGDEKELGFLKTLLNSEEVKVNKAVKTTIKKLEDKYSSIQEEVSIDNEEPEVIAEDLILDNIKSESVKITSAIQPEEDVVISFEANDEEIVPDNRLPLELCFLYDEFGIQASKSEENDFDFELSEEFFLNLNNKKEEHEH
jgi:molybdopterin converting factor small subunit